MLTSPERDALLTVVLDSLSSLKGFDSASTC